MSVLKCRTILGHNNLDFSIDCLQSLFVFSSKEIQLQIFQDGTLTYEDKAALHTALKNCTIIEKQESEQIVLEKLAAYPYCRKWRTNNFYSLKFFDIMLYDNSNFLYVDTDILFFQKFAFPSFDEVPVFMIDNYTTYSFSPLDFLKIKTPIFRKLNAGFNYFPNHLFDVEFVEHLLKDAFLQQCFYGKWCGVAEQTLWAFLAARQDSIYFFDARQVVMAHHNMKVTDETVAVHLTRPFRHKYGELKASCASKPDSGTSKDVRLKKVSQHMNKYEFASEWIASKFEAKFRQLIQPSFA